MNPVTKDNANDSFAKRARVRILFVLLGSIGDVVRALPLLGRVRQAMPDAFIAWAVEPKSKDIIEGHPWLDKVIIYDRNRAPWSFPRFLWQIRAERFDIVLDLQRHFKSGVVSFFSGAPDRIGFAPENTKEFNHWFSTRYIAPQPSLRLKLLQYQAFGDLLGLPSTPISFGLEPTPSENEQVERLLAHSPEPRLGVILGSSWPSRVYFPDAIAQIISELAKPHDGLPPLFPVLLGGTAETSMALEVIQAAKHVPVLDLTGRTSLRVLATVFTRCAVAFGPDSGPMHIAAAVGCPVVSLWGATAPERSAPWGFSHLVLRGEIPCHPCYLRRCPIGRECMRRIDPRQVVELIRGVLAQRLNSRAFNTQFEEQDGQITSN